jgi:hypothetical protein
MDFGHVRIYWCLVFWCLPPFGSDGEGLAGRPLPDKRGKWGKNEEL